MARVPEWRLAFGDLRNSRAVTLARSVVSDMFARDAPHLAAGVAYYAIFSLFPAILGFLAIAGVVLNSVEFQQKFLGFVTSNFPGSEELVRGNPTIRLM